MRRALLLALALFTVGILVAPSASAAPPYTPETLAALLPSQSELEAATGLTFNLTQDLKAGSDPVTGGRAYAVGNGTFISVNLFSSADGAPPDPALVSSLLDGSYLHQALASTFNVIDRYETLRPLTADGSDNAASFASMVRGETYSLVGDAFVRGNVYGVVIYGSTGAVDTATVRRTVALLITKVS